MPSMTTADAIMRPELLLFYVLDTSGSMKGESITRLNSAMVETIDAVREEAPHNRDAAIKVAALSFNTTCHWVNPRGAERIEDFVWHDLEAGGFTSVGPALDELNARLSDKSGGFINTTTGALMPVIIFMTDGFATDGAGSYSPALERIKHNKWFSNATRVGFAIGKNPDVEMLSRLTGDSEAVLRTEDLAEFAEMIKWVSVTSSMIASRTNTQGTDHRGRIALRKAQERTGRHFNDPGHDYEYLEEPETEGTWGPDGSDAYDEDEWDVQNPF